MAEGGRMGASSASSASWHPGDVIAEKYVLQRPLAKGGMGAVWVAQNRLTERRVAIKFVLPELAQSSDTIQRFFREAKASARIDHPCIVDVLDLGTLDDGAPFMVMEYLEGRSLEQIVEERPLDPLQAAALLLDVVHALSAAHAAGIVHRDLKPANLFVARRGEGIVPKILDFGVSKITSSVGDVRMTRTGAVLGSPAYMSPEQARGRSDIDGRADVWAVGVILYEAVSGKLPFSGENYNQVMMAITLDPATPLASAVPGIDPDFVAIVDACLQKDRDLRPPTMDALAALLDGYVAPRAAYGIAPIDLGDLGEGKKAANTTYKIGAAISPRPAAGTPARSKPPSDVQLTVRAVTVGDESPRRGRGRAIAVASVAVAVLSIAAWVLLPRMRGGPVTGGPAIDSVPPAETPVPPAPVSVETIYVPVPVVPSAEDLSAEELDPPTHPGGPPRPRKPRPKVAPSVSVSAAPSVVPSAPASASVPRPPTSATPSEPEGPANVGPGPGF
jgi:serine/threonine-protein kinase